MNSNWLRGSTRGTAAGFAISIFDATATLFAGKCSFEGINDSAEIEWFDTWLDTTAGGAAAAAAAGASISFEGADGMPF